MRRTMRWVALAAFVVACGRDGPASNGDADRLASKLQGGGN